jgi:hypothetical protein
MLECMEEVRRVDDDELCGYVSHRDGSWCAQTVFGAELGRHDHRDGAVDQVLAEGLASLADRWTLVEGATGEEQVVCIQEAKPATVTLALDYYSLPGVPTLTLTTEQLTSGDWHLRR